MSNPSSSGATRASLLSSATSTRYVARFVAGSAVIAAPLAVATDSLWTGSVDNDWNKPANWNPMRVPTAATGLPAPDDYDDARIDILTNFPVLTSNVSVSPRDVKVGIGAGANGRLDQRAGILPLTGGWLFAGDAGGTGEWNLANTGVAGGGITGFAQGSANISGAGRWYIGRGAGSIGVARVNTSGTIALGSELQCGSGGGNGTLYLESGTINTGSWTEFGNNGGSTGTLHMTGGTIRLTSPGTGANQPSVVIGTNGGPGVANVSGGTITSNNRFRMGTGGSSNGTLNFSGGTIETTASHIEIGRDGGTALVNMTGGTMRSQAEFWVGQGAAANGTVNLSAGQITAGSWTAVGRENGTGTVTMTGGTYIQSDNGDASFIVGASGPGTWTQSGGTLDIRLSRAWIGENGNATFSLSGTGVMTAPEGVEVARGGGSTSTLNLNGGGTLNTNWIRGGGGNATVNFNGTQINVLASNADFMSNIDTAVIGAGNLLVNTAGFTSSGAQALSGSGNLVKSGAGSLALLGAHSYTGTSTVTAGKLTLPNDATGTGDVQVDAGASFGITEGTYNAQFSPANVTFADASSIDFNFTDPSGVIQTNAPLNVTTNLSLGGDLVVNYADVGTEIGSLPLIAYAGKTGAGSAVLGNLPENVVASLNDSGSLISLNIISNAPLAWDGSAGALWTTAFNWYDEETMAVATYANGRWINFDDLAAGTTSITLSSTVTPYATLFENATAVYDLSGTGSIGGTGRLIKRGAALTTISTPNTYDGITRIEGGTLSIPTIANGGAPSPLGDSSSDPSNLVLAGGTLDYSGSAAASTDRGFTIAAADSNISVSDPAGVLTIAGQVVGTAGNFRKLGAGSLSLTFDGLNDFGTQNQGIRVKAGTLRLEGSGNQVNSVPGECWMAETEGVSASLILNNTTFNVDSWIAIGRGSGTGATATVTLTDSTVTSANCSAGYNAGLATNDSTQNISLLGASTWTNAGNLFIAESGNSTTSLSLAGTSQFTTNNNNTRIGLNGNAMMTLAENAVFTSNGDTQIAEGANSTTSVTQTGGTFNVNGDHYLYIGQNGDATWNQSGGTVNANGWVVIGRLAGSDSAVNVSGGTFNQLLDGRNIVVAENGNGTLTVTGSGVVNSAGGKVDIATRAGDTGTVSVSSGGTLIAREVSEDNGGTSSLTLDNGTLQAAAGASADFVRNIDTATIEAGGATVDTNGQDIAISQVFGGAGGLTKIGAGHLAVDGANTFAGTTTVAVGSLGGSGSLTGPLLAQSGASVAPGASAGTFTAGDTTLAAGSTYAFEIDGFASDLLAVNGNLTITGSSLAITELNPVATASYVIATYTGTLAGTFSGGVTLNGGALPGGWSIDYGTGSNSQITLNTGVVSAYDTWAMSFGLDPLTDGAPDADADNNGQSNKVEFVFMGNPVDGEDNAKIYVFAADSDADTDTDPELLMTALIRDGGDGAGGDPVFSGDPLTGVVDGFNVGIQGSLADLGAFAGTVTEATTPVTPGLPTAPAGAEYRSWSLDGSNNFPDSGFLRADVTP